MRPQRITLTTYAITAEEIEKIVFIYYKKEKDRTQSAVQNDKEVTCTGGQCGWV